MKDVNKNSAKNRKLRIDFKIFFKSRAYFSEINNKTPILKLYNNDKMIKMYRFANQKTICICSYDFDRSIRKNSQL